jgi:hypothetical protein
MQSSRIPTLSRRALRAPWDPLGEITAIVLMVVLVCFLFSSF